MKKKDLDRIIYRSIYRGCKETEIMLTSFVRNEIYNLSDADLSDYEALLEIDDSDLYRMVLNPGESFLLKKINYYSKYYSN